MTDKKIFLVSRSFSEKRLQEKILNIIKDFPNPYPPDIFNWDNQEQITDTRGKYNKLFFTIVENTKDDIAKLIVEEELENHAKEVALTHEELELIKFALKLKIKFWNEMYNYADSVSDNFKDRKFQKSHEALLKKLEALK